MSELKAKHVVDVYDAYSANPYNESQVYLKSEADKVIAELKEHVKGLILDNYLKDKELRRQKHKRCLAMAQQLFNERTYWHYRYDDWGDRGYDRKYKWGKVKWCGKWGRKWLAIAVKFKPNSTAQ